MYLICSVIGIAAGAGSATAKSYGTVLAARVFVGIGTSTGMEIGASVVADMYFMHQRGRYMGIYIVFLSNGAHIASICGCMVAKYTHSWRWCYWVPTIAQAATLLVNIFLLPETLYHRDHLTGDVKQEYTTSWLQLLTFRNAKAKRWPKLYDFTHAFLMLRYPSVLFTFIYYSYAFGLGAVLFAVTPAAAFGGIYHFDPAQVGLAFGVSTTVGCTVGELFSGPVSDFILLLHRKRTGGSSTPEARLHAMWPALVLVPAGVIIEGVCFQYKTHWVGPCMGIGVGAFGLQIASTNIFA
jgi:MFS family permease